MENLEQAITLVNAEDRRHAYYTVKVAEAQQKFLCFKWEDEIYLSA